MARSRGRVRPFTRPASRSKIWIGFGVGDDTIAATSNTFIASYSAGALLLRPFTILRTRVDVLWESDQLAVSERPIGSFGAIVVKDAAINVGVTALPNPDSIAGDPDAEWLVHQSMSVSFKRQTDVGYRDIGHHYTIDSKSMRKVGINEDLALMVGMNSSVGSVFTAHGRQLLMLH